MMRERIQTKQADEEGNLLMICVKGEIIIIVQIQLQLLFI